MSAEVSRVWNGAILAARDAELEGDIESCIVWWMDAVRWCATHAAEVSHARVLRCCVHVVDEERRVHLRVRHSQRRHRAEQACSEQSGRRERVSDGVEGDLTQSVAVDRVALTGVGDDLG